MLRRCNAVALFAPSYHTSTLLRTISWKSQCRRPNDVRLTFLALCRMDHESCKTTPHRGLGTLKRPDKKSWWLAALIGRDSNMILCLVTCSWRLIRKSVR
jgi:hypothetical protein